MSAELRTIILTGLAIGGVGGVVLADLKLNDAVVQNRSVPDLSFNAEPLGELDAAAIAKAGPSEAVLKTEGSDESEAHEATSADSPQMSTPESPPVQIAALIPPDQVHISAKEEPNDFKTADECLASERCIDQYLWSLYQRAPKIDTIKVVEQKKASVVKKGKLQTIIQKKLVRED